MSTHPPIPAATTMRDLVPRLQAVLTVALMTGCGARLSVAGRARVDMPLTVGEVGMLVDAVTRAAEAEEKNDPMRLAPWNKP